MLAIDASNHHTRFIYQVRTTRHFLRFAIVVSFRFAVVSHLDCNTLARTVKHIFQCGITSAPVLLSVPVVFVNVTIALIAGENIFRVLPELLIEGAVDYEVIGRVEQEKEPRPVNEVRVSDLTVAEPFVRGLQNVQKKVRQLAKEEQDHQHDQNDRALLLVALAQTQPMLEGARPAQNHHQQVVHDREHNQWYDIGERDYVQVVVEAVAQVVGEPAVLQEEHCLGGVGFVGHSLHLVRDKCFEHYKKFKNTHTHKSSKHDATKVAHIFGNLVLLTYLFLSIINF